MHKVCFFCRVLIWDNFLHKHYKLIELKAYLASFELLSKLVFEKLELADIN